MAILSLVSWWYTTGWLILLKKSAAKLQAILRFFSIPLLIGSLFAPFRQISAGRVRGPLKVHLQAFADRLFSRVIGAIVRTLLIIVGTAILIVVGIVMVMAIFLWPLMPVLPLVGFVLMTQGGSQ